MTTTTTPAISVIRHGDLHIQPAPPKPAALPLGHPYGDQVWLPYLGPLPYLAARHLMRRALTQPAGLHIPRHALAAACGVKAGDKSPIGPALDRLARLALIAPRHHDGSPVPVLEVDIRWPFLTDDQARALSRAACEFHHQTIAELHLL